MSRRVGYFVLTGVFVLGVVAGGGAMLAWIQTEHAAMAAEGRPLPRHRLRALKRKLDLDANQEARVATILTNDDDESRVIGREVVARCGERLRDHKAHVDDEIRDVLRPDQQKRFERIVERRRAPRAP